MNAKTAMVLFFCLTGTMTATAQETAAPTPSTPPEETVLEEKKKGITTEKDNRFFSVGLFSSADSIKTSVNLELGFKVFKKDNAASG